MVLLRDRAREALHDEAPVHCHHQRQASRHHPHGLPEDRKERKDLHDTHLLELRGLTLLLHALQGLLKQFEEANPDGQSSVRVRFALAVAINQHSRGHLRSEDARQATHSLHPRKNFM